MYRFVAIRLFLIVAIVAFFDSKAGALDNGVKINTSVVSKEQFATFDKDTWVWGIDVGNCGDGERKIFLFLDDEYLVLDPMTRKVIYKSTKFLEGVGYAPKLLSCRKGNIRIALTDKAPMAGMIGIVDGDWNVLWNLRDHGDDMIAGMVVANMDSDGENVAFAFNHLYQQIFSLTSDGVVRKEKKYSGAFKMFIIDSARYERRMIGSLDERYDLLSFDLDVVHKGAHLLGVNKSCQLNSVLWPMGSLNLLCAYYDGKGRANVYHVVTSEGTQMLNLSVQFGAGESARVVQVNSQPVRLIAGELPYLAIVSRLHQSIDRSHFMIVSSAGKIAYSEIIDTAIGLAAMDLGGGLEGVLLSDRHGQLSLYRGTVK